MEYGNFAKQKHPSFETLSVYSDNELSNPLLIEIKKHLKNCLECSAKQQKIIQIKSLVSRLPEVDSSIPLDFSFISKPSKIVPFPNKKQWYVPTSAVALLLIALGLFVGGKTGVPTSGSIATNIGSGSPFLENASPTMTAHSDQGSSAPMMNGSLNSSYSYLISTALYSNGQSIELRSNSVNRTSDKWMLLITVHTSNPIGVDANRSGLYVGQLREKLTLLSSNASQIELIADVSSQEVAGQAFIVKVILLNGREFDLPVAANAF
jgi:hypothetical protein